MALVVQKYGGTSVGSIERIRAVAKRVVETRMQGNLVVVVVSAMSGETDRLINMALKISEYPRERELDMLMATGEQASMALLAIAIHELGYEAKSLTGHQARILTNREHTRAKILSIETEKILKELEDGKIIIVAGFQGCDDQGEITTLGRGGSDLSGVALAASLKADVCEIYTDVDGVFTADPNIVPEAAKIPRISYDEMLELAGLGAKVLQTRSVEFAKKFGVAIHVRSSFNNQEGTLVTGEDAEMESVLVRGVTCSKNEAKITITGVPDKPGIAARIFSEVSRANIMVDMIIQNISEQGKTDISFTVPKVEAGKAVETIKKIADDLGIEDIKSDPKIAKISVVGLGMRSHTGVASTMFSSLAGVGINILMISTSEIAISCVIDEKFSELSVRILHEAFGLSAQEAAKS
ncbi:MAG: aspartate kinase [bacterium]